MGCCYAVHDTSDMDQPNNTTRQNTAAHILSLLQHYSYPTSYVQPLLFVPRSFS